MQLLKIFLNSFFKFRMLFKIFEVFIKFNKQFFPTLNIVFNF